MQRDGSAPTAFPRYLSLETVSTCNASCVFCPHPVLQKNKNKQKMSEALFEKIIEECTHYEDLEIITLSFQNEPLTDPAIFDRIGYVRSKTREKVKITLVTNGSLLTARKIEQLLANPPDILKISFTGLTPQEYETQMKGLKFHRTMANIEALIKRTANMARPSVQINCVYTKPSEMQGVRAINTFWAEKGLKLHIINVENRAGLLRDEQNGLSSNRWNIRTWCKRPEEQLSVWPDGDVALCCADWQREVVLGNVNDLTLHEIWHGDTISHYRKMLRNGCIAELYMCKDCMAAEVEFEGASYPEFGKTAEQLAP